jgi:serine/threonine-protein kinase
MTDSRHDAAPGTSGIGPGTELNQTYRVDSLIGIGGMGEVYRGRNIQTGDPVAIKIVLPEYARDEMILELFRKEARILNHLYDDAIVRYYVFAFDPIVRRPYLAMEYVDGPSLAEHIRSRPLTVEQALFLKTRLAGGLQKAHEAGIVHRDMSPDNVILPYGRFEQAKIIDFGIARSTHVGGTTLLGGSFAGKYNFVSPEQLGLFGGDVGPQSDIYSLGLVLAAALQGGPIDMSGTQVEVVEKRRAVPDLRHIDPQLRGLLEAMLEPDPARRMSSMAQVRDWRPSAARPAAESQPTIIRPRGPPTSPPPSQRIPPNPRGLQNKATAKRMRGGLLLAFLAVAVIAAGVAGGWFYVYRMANARPDAGADFTVSVSGDATDATVLATVKATDRDSGSGSRNGVLTYAIVSDESGIFRIDPATGEIRLKPGDRFQPGQRQSYVLAVRVTDGGRLFDETKVTINVSAANSRPNAGNDMTVSVPADATDSTVLAKVQAVDPDADRTDGLAEKFGNLTYSIAADDSGKFRIDPRTGELSLKPGQKFGTDEPGTYTAMVRVTDGGDLSDDVAVTMNVAPQPKGFLGKAAIEDFVDSYDGGDCFYATVVSFGDRKVSILGYGKVEEPFREFLRAFVDRFGYEPDIQLRPVSEAQCSTVTSLRRLGYGRAGGLNIRLSKYKLENGGSLEGTVTDGQGRNVDLLLIGYDGAVQNLRKFSTRTGADTTFRIRLQKLDSAGAKGDLPMLILAVASRQPVGLFDTGDVFTITDVLPKLTALAGPPSGLVASVSYFKLTGPGG